MRLELAIAQTTAPRSSHSDKTQRLGLAVALANRPRLVLADEPTSQLDRKTAGGVLDDLRKLQRELRTSVLLVTHDRKLERHVDRVVAIRDGRTSTETRWRSDETADELVIMDRVGRIRLPDNSGSTLASTVRFSRPHQGATVSLISKMPLSTPGRTPYKFNRPFVIRELPTNASQRLTQQEISKLVRTLTTRDIAILTALSNYRYLNRDQVEQLFFPSRRVSQRRIKWLKDHGLVYRWLMIEPPGWTRLHSLVLLSPRGGARVLAASLGREPRPLVRLAEDYRDHCFNVGHDLGANAFFVALAVASGSLANEGLYHWVGEERCRRLLREDAGPKYAPAPDGWGRYLVAGREVIFFLEWDRGTESVDRLLRKSENYIRYFVKRVAADYNHILFVFPSLNKELAYHKGLAKQLPADERCCVFWTTTVDQLQALGSRGPIWWKVGRRPPSDGTARAPLGSLAGRPEHEYSAASCIGKSDWWDRRPAGGQV